MFQYAEITYTLCFRNYFKDIHNYLHDVAKYYLVKVHIFITSFRVFFPPEKIPFFKK